MFAFTDIDLKQTRFYQQARSEGLEEGLEEGIEKGIEKGIVKGRVEGEATLLLRLLERRFGPLPAATRQRIAASDADTLLLFGERVLDASSLDEVFGPCG
jgi:predicted transposase YdaD